MPLTMQVCLLGAWIRTGFWVTVEGRKRLRIRLLQDDDALRVDCAAPSTEFTLSVQLKDGKVSQFVFEIGIHMNRIGKLA